MVVAFTSSPQTRESSARPMKGLGAVYGVLTGRLKWDQGIVR